jgi:hypothetical protein
MAVHTNVFRGAAALACATLAGCASAPVEQLLVSSTIVSELPYETGATVEASNFSEGRAGELPPGWRRFVVSPFDGPTEYRLAAANPSMVLEAHADRSASGLYRRIRIDPRRQPIVEWRWRVLEPVAHADPRRRATDDSPARLVISFHGDARRLDIEERHTLELYKALTGEKLPFAILMYIWSDDAPLGTIAASVHTPKIQMIVVDREHVGQWREFQRNILEDYRRAFGEDPWDIVSVGVMTDANNTGRKSSAQYGDIRFRAAP